MSDTIQVRSLVQTLLRYAILGGLVFGTVTYVPKTELPFQTRVIIGVVVTVIYALMDLFTDLLPIIKSYTCRWACDCEPAVASASAPPASAPASRT